MTNRNDRPPGDLVYLSDRKLLNLAIHFGVKTRSREPGTEIEKNAGFGLNIPPVTHVSAGTSVRSKRVDPGEQQRSVARQLDQVVDHLGGDELPNLEVADSVSEAGWFRFHRHLRFGMGSSDSNQSVQALVVVDEEHILEGLALPALLMTGAAEHVRPPYASDEMRDAPGERSGSGSGYLFQWLDAARRTLEEDPESDLEGLDVPLFLSDHPPRDTSTALDMYRLFSEDRWLKQPQFPQLLNGAPCEGVAQASFIATSENLTLVMGSPLFLRIRALPESDGDAESRRAKRGWMRRLFGS